VAASIAARTADISRRVAALGLESIPEAQRGPHLLAMRLPEQAGARAIATLASVNCFAALRGTSLRISPHLHTTDADVDRLLDGLAAIGLNA
jgi:selenocysteine lyase/cysteine desulfurase